MNENDSVHVPVSYESCEHIAGPFYHGTKSALDVGDELIAGYGSNFQSGRISNNISKPGEVESATLVEDFGRRSGAEHQ
jgi:rifampin ADP-ribosylating transferase